MDSQTPDDNNPLKKEEEIQKLYDFVAEQVIAGLYKSDIIEKLIELGVEKHMASELVEEMERRLERMRKKRIMMVMPRTDEKKDLMGDLRVWGYELFEVETLTKAFDALSDVVPNLILAEQDDMEIDNYAFINRLRKDPIGRKIPVFIFSGRKAMHESFAALGLTEFVEKPYRVEDIVQRIKRILIIPRRSWE